MVGSTAQVAALTCHLNARKLGIATHDFIPDNSTCKFCESIHFLRQKRGWFNRRGSWQVVARTPNEWLDSIVESGFSRAVLVHNLSYDAKLSDRMSAGFVGGGGRWLLCVEQNKQSDYWEASWEVGNREAADRRIWKVQYALVAAGPIAKSPAISIDELANQLVGALTEIETFARKHDLSGFADCFAKAQKCLGADDPFSLVYHRDLAPEGALSLPAARLLASCQAAWVFGGMGSWNDLGFDGDDQIVYQKLSDCLYDLLNKAICAGVNETADAVR